MVDALETWRDLEDDFRVLIDDGECRESGETGNGWKRGLIFSTSVNHLEARVSSHFKVKGLI
jgi:hypothetical protein